MKETGQDLVRRIFADIHQILSDNESRIYDLRMRLDEYEQAEKKQCICRCDECGSFMQIESCVCVKCEKLNETHPI